MDTFWEILVIFRCVSQPFFSQLLFWWQHFLKQEVAGQEWLTMFANIRDLFVLSVWLIYYETDVELLEIYVLF